MQDINLDEPTSRNESGTLAYLWRKILKENNWVQALPMLINRYIDDDKSPGSNINNVKKMNRSTLINNITAKEMTFKTFLNLIFNVLKVKKINISIKLIYANGRSSTHSIIVSNPTNDNATDENINEENTTKKGDNNDND